MKKKADMPEKGAKPKNKDQGSPKPAAAKPKTQKQAKSAPKAPAATRPLPPRKAPAPKR